MVAAAEAGPLIVNTINISEVSIGFSTIEAVDEAPRADDYSRDPIPWSAAFLAGKVILDYRRNRGAMTATLPDFFIGTHAAVADLRLLTRDVGRDHTYFPTLELVTPGT